MYFSLRQYSAGKHNAQDQSLIRGISYSKLLWIPSPQLRNNRRKCSVIVGIRYVFIDDVDSSPLMTRHVQMDGHNRQSRPVHLGWAKPSAQPSSQLSQAQPPRLFIMMTNIIFRLSEWPHIPHHIMCLEQIRHLHNKQKWLWLARQECMQGVRRRDGESNGAATELTDQEQNQYITFQKTWNLCKKTRTMIHAFHAPL